MKILYFDLIGGISGDMTAGALIDLGVGFDRLKAELKKIKVRGYRLKTGRVERGHAQAVKFDVIVEKNKNYSYRQIVRLIRTSRLSQKVKEDMLKVYRALREAETKVHGHAHREIKFEQLGDIDSLVDVAAACIGLDKLNAGRLFYSVVPLNRAVAPATWELLKDKKIYFTGLPYENVTPTGMALLSALGEQMDGFSKDIFAAGPAGYGAGSLDPLECANVLRVLELKKGTQPLETDEVCIVEANIDDMNPQFFECIFERLFEAGALDVFLTPVTMKKTRPGFLLTVLSRQENLGKITHLVLEETTTLGVRFYPARRLKLSRKTQTLILRGLKVRVKLASGGAAGLKVMPEYEDCKRLSAKAKIPLWKIYREAEQKAEDKWRSQG